MAQTRQCDRLIETSLGGHRSRHGVKGGTEVQIDDYVHTVGRAIQPADPLSSGSSRLKRRLRPGLAAPHQPDGKCTFVAGIVAVLSEHQ